MEEKMASKNPIRIAITGPESTGKSLLCEQLASYFGEPWVKEYAREYLENLGTNYSFGDILSIAHGQFEKEKEALLVSKQYLFCDTDFLVTHIWSLVKFGKTHKWITEMASSHAYDYTLLCNIDLPWEYDPLRENKNNRQQLFDMFIDELALRNIKYSVVSGLGIDRFNNAIEILEVNGIIKSK